MATYQSFNEDLNCDLLIENGDFVMVEDAEFVAQQIGTDYRLAKNNWFLDLDEGLNYIDGDDGIYGARSITPELEQAFIITSTEGVGVRELSGITFDLDSNSSFTVKPVIISEFAPDEIKLDILI